MNAGDIISGRYRLHSRIGEGGQASVWKATDLTLNREVAIKFIYASDAREREELATGFLREARICAAVRHRNVVQILDFGTAADSVPYMVLELLKGETVADRLDVGMDMQEILEVAVKTLEGLAEVHAAGIVHRDLKPENILLARDSSGTHPKLLDFGISKMLDSDGVSRSAVTTRIGRVIGTPEYMSPEQARGVQSLDHRTDLYAMGVVIYETIAGRAPYEPAPGGDLMMMVIEGKAPPRIERAPG
ncbi:MAG: serine/threonine-protein kinase, partial [Myxococcales bacterium]|nr:serine/threonine-protein kinase [Myxococcales bacterium]